MRKDMEPNYIYVKDKRGRKTGTIVCVLVKNGHLFTGQSICSEADQFNRKVGRPLALSRALAEYEKVKDKINITEVLPEGVPV